MKKINENIDVNNVLELDVKEVIDALFDGSEVVDEEERFNKMRDEWVHHRGLFESCKELIVGLSGSEKLKLFNWMKNQGSSSKSGMLKNVGVGDFVREKIFEGLSNAEIVEECKKKYGNEQTTYNCVVWYRNKMKKEGLV